MPQRSPVIFWLLLAATICVDGVAISWMLSHPFMDFAAAACEALFLGQVSAICIWSALCLTKSWWTRIAPWLAVIVASLVLGTLFMPLNDGLPYYGLHTALLLSMLWLFERTTFWRRRSGATPEWRYSLGRLLIAMTIVAVLAATMRHSQAFYGEPYAVWGNIAFIFGSVALSVFSVISWSIPRHWLIQFAGVLGFAVLLGTAFGLTMDRPFTPLFPIIIGACYLIQAIVLSAWIGLGHIIPVSHASAAEG